MMLLFVEFTNKMKGMHAVCLLNPVHQTLCGAQPKNEHVQSHGKNGSGAAPMFEATMHARMQPTELKQDA